MEEGIEEETTRPSDATHDRPRPKFNPTTCKLSPQIQRVNFPRLDR